MTRHQLITAYRERKLSMGVFQIRCTDGQTYLGASTDMPALWNRHRFQLELGSHRNQVLLVAWRKWGPDAFVYEVVEELNYQDNGPHDYAKDLKALLSLCLEERRSQGATLLE